VVFLDYLSFIDLAIPRSGIAYSAVGSAHKKSPANCKRITLTINRASCSIFPDKNIGK
jgi:hypothetical protein